MKTLPNFPKCQNRIGKAPSEVLKMAILTTKSGFQSFGKDNIDHRIGLPNFRKGQPRPYNHISPIPDKSSPPRGWVFRGFGHGNIDPQMPVPMLRTWQHRPHTGTPPSHRPHTRADMPLHAQLYSLRARKMTGTTSPKVTFLLKMANKYQSQSAFCKKIWKTRYFSLSLHQFSTQTKQIVRL